MLLFMHWHAAISIRVVAVNVGMIKGVLLNRFPWGPIMLVLFLKATVCAILLPLSCCAAPRPDC